MDGGFFRQQLQLYAMDRVHGLPLYRAPALLLRRHTVALPATELGEGARGRYIRRQGCGQERHPESSSPTRQTQAAKEGAQVLPL